ncbi:hypothetical protein AARAC_009448, partial [Aspergillus arachidicola]
MITRWEKEKGGVSPDGWDIPTMHCNTVFGAMMTRLRVEPWTTALVDGLGRSAQFVKATETRASGFAWYSVPAVPTCRAGRWLRMSATLLVCK